MDKKDYQSLLKDPRWQRKRLEIMQRDNFACQHCGNSKGTLTVHHKFYKENYNPWDYEEDCYITLCERCHAIEHKIPIIGEVYSFSHSDYINYEICFKADSNMVYLFGIDNGSYMCGYLDVFSLESFKNKCEIENDFFNEENYYLSNQIISLLKDIYNRDYRRIYETKSLMDKYYTCFKRMIDNEDKLKILIDEYYG